MPERDQGGIDSRQWPKTAADLAELEAEADVRAASPRIEDGGDSPSAQQFDGLPWEPPFIDLAEASVAYGMNGRETAFYAIGKRAQWIERTGISQAEGDLLNEYVQAGGSFTRMRMRVAIDQLAAVTAVLVSHGCRVERYSGDDRAAITLNVD